MNNLIQKRSAMTIDSVEIAEMIGVNHKEILRKLEGASDRKGYVEILTEHQMVPSDYFIPSTYKDESGKENKCYLFTKMGCEFIANKFTGEKGILFTAKYVERFNEMEDKLLIVEKPQPLKIDSKFLFQIATQLEEKEKQIALMQPKADYFDNLVERNLLTNFRDTAKELKIKESTFIDWLLKKYVYRDSKRKLKPYAEYVPSLFEVKEFAKGNYKDTQTLITPRGRETFRLLLIQDGLIEEAV